MTVLATDLKKCFVNCGELTPNTGPNASPVALGDPFIFKNGTVLSGKQKFEPNDANAEGLVTGFAGQWQYGNQTAKIGSGVWDNGNITILPRISNASSTAQSVSLGINDLSNPMVVGVDVDADQNSVAVLWIKVGLGDNWKVKNLGPWDQAANAHAPLYGDAWTVNDRGEILGSFGLMQNGQIVDLNTRTPDSYRNFYPYDINNNGAMLASATRVADGTQVNVLLVPLEVLVDGNRDGHMDAGNAGVHNMDLTSADHPFRFWINDDEDVNYVTYPPSEGETVPVNVADSTRQNILTKRDLEDWARFWIDGRAIAPMLKDGTTISVALQFKPFTGNTWPNGPTPSIKMCEAYEPDGGGCILQMILQQVTKSLDVTTCLLRTYTETRSSG